MRILCIIRESEGNSHRIRTWEKACAVQRTKILIDAGYDIAMYLFANEKSCSSSITRRAALPLKEFI